MTSLQWLFCLCYESFYLMKLWKSNTARTSFSSIFWINRATGDESQPWKKAPLMLVPFLVQRHSMLSAQSSHTKKAVCSIFTSSSWNSAFIIITSFVGAEKAVWLWRSETFAALSPRNDFYGQLTWNTEHFLREAYSNTLLKWQFYINIMRKCYLLTYLTSHKNVVYFFFLAPNRPSCFFWLC